MGQTFGDMASVLIGGVETMLGLEVAGAGVLAEVPSAGLSTVAVVAGGTVAAHGTMTTLNGLESLVLKMTDDSPQKSKSAKESTNKTEQLDGVEKAQEKAKKERPSTQYQSSDWEGSKSRPKQNKINSIEKSKTTVCF